jgi:uncharacterized protein YneF (UPF0154 family)
LTSRFMRLTRPLKNSPGINPSLVRPLMLACGQTVYQTVCGVCQGNLHAVCCLTKKAEPPPTRGVNRDSGTASANGGWLRRLVRHHLDLSSDRLRPIMQAQLWTKERMENIGHLSSRLKQRPRQNPWMMLQLLARAGSQPNAIQTWITQRWNRS